MNETHLHHIKVKGATRWYEVNGVIYRMENMPLLPFKFTLWKNSVVNSLKKKLDNTKLFHKHQWTAFDKLPDYAIFNAGKTSHRCSKCWKWKYV